MKSMYGQRTPGLALIFITFLAVLPHLLVAQADKRQFIVIEYLKVRPDMRSNFLKLQKDVWKKVEQEKIKQGKLNGWELYEVLYPAGTTAEYNFVMYHKVVGWNAIEGLSEG
ncbi:MAG TPA: hypothetical protein VLA58_07295, partial [Chitinophagaceae bacterium]|nr:hypothetical protein [Chitinophagaceae bacterium]